MSRLSPGRLHIVVTNEAFSRETGIAVGTPLLHHAEGTINEVVLAFFLRRRRKRAVSTGTMLDDVYVIREWLEDCTTKRRSWDRPEDAWLAEWRDAMLARTDVGGPQPARIAHKLACVFRFYLELPACYPWDERNRPRRQMVAGPGEDVLPGGGMLTCREVGGERVWSEAETVDRDPDVPDVPTDQDVAEVMRRLRMPRLDPSRTWGDDTGWLLAERNHLIGRCMTEVGLRAEEVAKLPLRAIWQALRKKGLPLPEGSPGDWHLLDVLATDESATRVLLDGLDARRRMHGNILWIRVIGKGRKARLAPVPIDLVKDLLAIGIFSIRRRQFEHWRSRGRAFPIPQVVFLSGKGPRALTPGSVGVVVARAFVGPPQIQGSPHRLRAWFCTQTAVRIVSEELDRAKGVWSDAILGTTHDRLARAMGHSAASTSVRFYLGMAVVYHSSRAGPGVALPYLTAEYTRMMTAIPPACHLLAWCAMERLASGGEGSVFAAALRMLLDRTDSQVTGFPALFLPV